MPMGTCKLCLRNEDLQSSHLMPRALYVQARGSGTTGNQDPCTVLPPGKNREKKRRRNGYSRGAWVSALVHATLDATASRFAGSSANKIPPITITKTTSVKSLWTPCIRSSTV
jgi:hypothetical protein